MRSTAGGSFSNNAAVITSSEPLAGITPFSIESHDIFDIGTPGVVDFRFKAWGSSEDGFTFFTSPSASTCVELDAASTVAAVEVGPARTPASGAFDLMTLGPCGSGEPPPPGPDPDTALGQPFYNGAVDTGVYIWRDAFDVWHMRTTAGGTFAQWIGSISSAVPFTVFNNFSIEGHDVVNSSASNTDFNLRIWGSAEDGFDFTFPEDTEVCLSMDSAPVGVATVGASNTSVPMPFNLSTLEACTP